METKSVALTMRVMASLADPEAAERARVPLVLDALGHEKMTWRAAANASTSPLIVCSISPGITACPPSATRRAICAMISRRLTSSNVAALRAHVMPPSAG